MLIGDPGQDGGCGFCSMRTRFVERFGEELGETALLAGFLSEAHSLEVMIYFDGSVGTAASYAWGSSLSSSVFLRLAGAEAEFPRFSSLLLTILVSLTGEEDLVTISSFRKLETSGLLRWLRFTSDVVDCFFLSRISFSRRLTVVSSSLRFSSKIFISG